MHGPDLQPAPAWGNMTNLVIENVGKTLARDVRFRFTPELESAVFGRRLNETTLVKEGIAFMPPGRRVHAWFDKTHERINLELPMRYDVTFNEAWGRPQQPLTYAIDLSLFYGYESVTEYGVHHVAKALLDTHALLQRWDRNGVICVAC